MAQAGVPAFSVAAGMKLAGKPEDYARITAKVALVADEAAMIAEDDQGGSYSYGQEGFPSECPTPPAAEWLGVRPRPEEH